MIPSYIAAPYAGSVPENLRRVTALAAVVLAEGRAPIVVHHAIAAGVWGSDDIPEERERGIAANLAVVRLVASGGGWLDVLTRDDGSLSAGTHLEVEAYREAGGAVVVYWCWEAVEERLREFDGIDRVTVSR